MLSEPCGVAAQRATGSSVPVTRNMASYRREAGALLARIPSHPFWKKEERGPTTMLRDPVMSKRVSGEKQAAGVWVLAVRKYVCSGQVERKAGQARGREPGVPPETRGSQPSHGLGRSEGSPACSERRAAWTGAVPMPEATTLSPAPEIV